MTLTRDQLRAARMLLHLSQKGISDLSGVSLPTIRRFETGSGIRKTQLDLIRDALVKAGAVLLVGAVPPGEAIGVGVALVPSAVLPELTSARIAVEEAHEAERIKAWKLRLQDEKGRPEPKERKPRGRRGKAATDDAPGS